MTASDVATPPATTTGAAGTVSAAAVDSTASSNAETTSNPASPPQYLPDEQTIAAAAPILVFNKQGVKLPFGDLFASGRTIVVFIRHFFCGSCQDYVAQLAAVPQKALDEAKTRIVLVGCGEWQLIETYKKITGFTGAVYAEPTRALYRALGMTRETLAVTPAGVAKRSYVGNMAVCILRSIWRGPIKNPRHAGKGGNIYQIGGDLILGPGNQCSFAHLMAHTQDHVEVVDLMQAAGVKYP